MREHATVSFRLIGCLLAFGISVVHAGFGKDPILDLDRNPCFGTGCGGGGMGSTVITVCSFGCDFNNVQNAINSIDDSGPGNVYTVLIGAGLYERDSSVDLSGRSHINFVGQGIGATVIQATEHWFFNSPTPDFFDASNTSHITFEHLTIDAVTNDPLVPGANEAPAGILLTDAHRILIESCEVRGLNYGIYDLGNDPGNLIQIFNSKIFGISKALVVRFGTWHVFGSELMAVHDGRASEFNEAVGVWLPDAQGDFTLVIWGTHIHAEFTGPEPVNVHGIQAFSAPDSETFIIGSTIHAKLATSTFIPGFPPSVFAINAEFLNARTTTNIFATDLVYETPDGLTEGEIGGIEFKQKKAQDASFNLVGVTFVDNNGSGGTVRADIVAEPVNPAGPSPHRLALELTGSRATSYHQVGAFEADETLAVTPQTLNDQRGSVSFSGSDAVVVTLPIAMPAANYRVGLSVDAPETIWITDKTKTGFTVRTTNASSTATVEWILAR